MDQPTKGAIDVLAQLQTECALTQVVEYRFSEPPESTLRPMGSFRIDLCLTGRHRGSRASFRDHWPARRFAPIGELFIAAPDTELITKSDEGAPLTSVLCTLSMETVLGLFDVVPEPTDRILVESLDVRHPVIRRLLLQLATEAKHPGFAGALMADLIARQLAIQLVRHGSSIANRNAAGGLAAWQLRLIDERLREVRAPPSLTDLSKLCRVSVRHLARGFRASRGCSLGAHVLNRQFENAKRLLAADDSVESIAMTLGFSTSSNFCFAFRRETGNTPGEYRRTLLRH